MAITQKFYPKFFTNAMLDNLTAAGGDSTSLTFACTTRLYTNTNGAYDAADETTSDLAGSAVSSTDKSTTVTIALDTSTGELSFSVPALSWSAPGTFRHAIIATTTGNYLLMHLNFGADITTAGTLTLNMGTAPKITFTV